MLLLYFISGDMPHPISTLRLITGCPMASFVIFLSPEE
jgi:hypothetical protein